MTDQNEAIKKLIQLATDGVIYRQIKQSGNIDPEAGIREVCELCIACGLIAPRPDS